MKVLMWKKRIGAFGAESQSEERELKLNEYNEFYLPSVDKDHELWVVVVDDEGNQTTLHLKR